GIIEAADGNGQRFGAERLVRLVEQSAGLSAEELIGRLKTELAGFIGMAGWGDDVTALVVKDRALFAENIKESLKEGLEEGANGVNVGTKEPEAQPAGLEVSLEERGEHAGH
ncbi:MAG TPA: hypothetical protein VFR89_00255, partial [candidate division Zixibacteria bacterium]|nr:hypothetical protein [candidate division Zixibacteria bacterium]